MAYGVGSGRASEAPACRSRYRAFRGALGVKGTGGSVSSFVKRDGSEQSPTFVISGLDAPGTELAGPGRRVARDSETSQQ
jgi:hypothetical protein